MKKTLALILEVSMLTGCEKNAREHERASNSKEAPVSVRKLENDKHEVINKTETTVSILSPALEEKIEPLINPLKYTLYTVLALAGIKLIAVLYPYVMFTGAQTLRFAIYLATLCPKPTLPAVRGQVQTQIHTDIDIESQTEPSMLLRIGKWFFKKYADTVTPSFSQCVQAVGQMLTNLLQEYQQIQNIPPPQYEDPQMFNGQQFHQFQ